jgi:putative oxidoreductase
LIAVMIAAVLTVHRPNGFFVSDNGYEYNLVLGAALFALAGIGAGAWSLDGALGIELAGSGWALGTLVAGAIGGLGAVASGHLAPKHASGRGKPHAA